MKHKILLLIIGLMFLLVCGVNAEAEDYIVKFKTVPTQLDTSVFEEIHKETGVYLVRDKEQLSKIEEYIEYIEKDEVAEIELSPTPAVPLLMSSAGLVPSKWPHELVNASYPWQYETYGNEIRIGVIDSGCYPHNDLADNLLSGWNYLDGNSDTSDENGHGTHVSGIIASKINSSGMVGVSPKAKIVPLRCIEADRSPTYSMIYNAICDAVDDFGCRIINMSWGLKQNKATIRTAIEYAASKGTILIAAVGNDYSSVLNYPAAYDDVIGVAAVSSDKSKYNRSNYNNSVFISAPGVSVVSTSNTNAYKSMTGTSQAAPHIAGIAALALSADKSITPARFAELLSETAEDLGATGYDTSFGYGLADTKALFDKIFEEIPYYVSPVNQSGNESYVLIKNNTLSPLNAQSLFACFADGRLQSVLKTPINLAPGESTTARCPLTQSTTHLLWSSLSDAEPLSQKR